MSRFTTISYGMTAGILGLILLSDLLTDTVSFSGLAISLGMLAAFWYCSIRSDALKAEIITSQVFLILNALGSHFKVFSKSFGGTGVDTWLHLLAAYLIMLFATRYFATSKMTLTRSLLFAFGLTFLLGLGVEVVQFIDKLLTNELPTECLGAWCEHWADSAKDLVNDALGALLYAIPRIIPSYGDGRPSRRGRRNLKGRARQGI